MKSIYLLITVFIISTISCTKKEVEPVDSIIFGTSHGFCIGDCASFFKLQNGNIYPDIITTAGQGSLVFSSTPLANDKYLLAKELKDNFPKYLLDNPNQTYGCPDCADQGAIYIEVTIKGKTNYWRIDTDSNKQPVEIKNYIQRLLSILSQL